MLSLFSMVVKRGPKTIIQDRGTKTGTVYIRLELCRGHTGTFYTDYYSKGVDF